MKLLIGSHDGLLLWHDGAVSNLLPGRVYGITKVNDTTWYCLHDEQLMMLTFEGDKLLHADPILHCSRGIHQIDMVGSELVLADTRRNQLLFYSDIRAAPVAVVPNGYQREGPPDETHLHLNSIHRHADTLYVLAHNLSVRFNRPSQVWEIDMSKHTVRDSYDIDGMACHNLYVDQTGILFLDSVGGRIMRDSAVLATLGPYLRGLSITADRYAIGISRPDRTGGGLLILDKQFVELARYDLPSQVFEIRCFDQPDFGMSNTGH